MESCPAGRFCNISDTLGSCAPRKFIGAICAVGSDCVTGACSSGLCALAATATPTPTRIAIGGPCVPVLATACVTGSCTHGVCCTEAACSLGERCDIFGLAGDCQPQLPPGALCSKSSDCRGGAACELDDGTFTCGNTSATPGPRGCFGDCNDDGAVTVDEILVMIEIALGPQPLANCTQGDINGDAQISVDELLVAVGLALTGCPPPGEPTPSPAATSSATATVATPSATVAASPAAATPTATATSAPTPPGLDLSGFDEFGFSRNSQAGACPPLGAVFAATIERDGDLHRLEMDVLRAGTAGVDDCLPDLETEADCVVAQPVSAAPTLLTPAEQARFSDIFGNIELAQHPDESCVDGEESCSASRYFWDAVSANDDPCSDTNRLAPQPAATILQFLEELRAARESNGE